MKRETPRTNRRRTGATLPAILTLLAATPAPVLAAYPAGTPVDTQEARPSAPIDPRTTPAVQLHLDERCRPGEVHCGTKTPAAPALPFGLAGLLSGGALARRRVRELDAMSGSTRFLSRRGPGSLSGSSVARASWRGMSLWYALVLLFAVALLWGCADGDDLVRPVSLEPDPGYLRVELTVREGSRIWRNTGQ